MKAKSAAYGPILDLLTFQSAEQLDEPEDEMISREDSSSDLTRNFSSEAWLREEVRPRIAEWQREALASPLDEVTGLVAIGGDRLPLTDELVKLGARYEAIIVNFNEAEMKPVLLQMAEKHARLAYFNGLHRVELLERFNQFVDDLELWLVRRVRSADSTRAEEVLGRLRRYLRHELCLIIPGWEKCMALIEQYRQRSLLLGATSTSSISKPATPLSSDGSLLLSPVPKSLNNWEQAASDLVPLFQEIADLDDGADLPLPLLISHGLRWCHLLFDGWLEAGLPITSDQLSLAHYWQSSLLLSLLSLHWHVPPLELRWPSRIQHRIPATWLVTQGNSALDQQRVRMAATHLIGAMRALVEEYHLLTLE